MVGAMTVFDQARLWLAAAADGMLVAGQAALMVASVVLALLIFLEAAKRDPAWDPAVQTDRAGQAFSETTAFGWEAVPGP